MERPIPAEGSQQEGDDPTRNGTIPKGTIPTAGRGSPSGQRRSQRGGDDPRPSQIWRKAKTAEKETVAAAALAARASGAAGCRAICTGGVCAAAVSK